MRSLMWTLPAAVGFVAGGLLVGAAMSVLYAGLPIWFALVVAGIAVLLLTPPRFDPAIRLKEAMTPKATWPEYVVWYIDPRDFRRLGKKAPRQYLVRDEGTSDTQSGGVYTRDVRKATRWGTDYKAEDHVPSYDGSAFIESRAGVEQVMVDDTWDPNL